MTAVASASSAPQAKSYARLAADAIFLYDIDYGSIPESTFNGTYSYSLRYRVNAIAVYDGRKLSVAGGMLADGGATVKLDMTQWGGPPPAPRRPVRCTTRAGSRGGQGTEYQSDTDGGLFSGGGGIGIANNRLSINPGRAIKWSIGCAATESMETHGLPGGPSLRVPSPPRTLFTQPKAFSILCEESYSHGWDPAADTPGAHKFEGGAYFVVRFTPFPATQLNATKKRLLDRAGENIPAPNVSTPIARPYKKCP
jgi:hypothetical protein